MKLKKNVSTMSRLVFIVFCVLGVLSQPIAAASEAIYINNSQAKWKPIGKGIHPSIPITASIDNRILSIENTSPDCDITITIINESGENVYQQEVSAVNTASICIPMYEFPAGEYTLELTSPSGNYLCGSFILYP